jgi:ketosteroid isomerase-like protein
MSDNVDLALLAERLEELTAKEAIREVLYTYCRAIDRGDLELLRSVYHPDGVDVHPTVFVGNAEEWASYIIPKHKAARISRHSITNPLIQIRDDRAFCESQYAVSLRTDLPNGRSVDLYSEGRYLDILERRSNLWKIRHRIVVNDKRTTRAVSDADATTQAGPSVDTSGFASAVGRADPVYRGFDIEFIRPREFRLASGMMDDVIRFYSDLA